MNNGGAIVVYWAAPYFTQAQRVWNRLCAACLEEKGYEVILSQDRAHVLIENGRPDTETLLEWVSGGGISCDVTVAVLDGCDSEEDWVLAVSEGVKVLGIVTDFPLSPGKQFDKIKYFFDEIFFFPSSNESYRELSDRIDKEIKALL